MNCCAVLLAVQLMVMLVWNVNDADPPFRSEYGPLVGCPLSPGVNARAVPVPGPTKAAVVNPATTSHESRRAQLLRIRVSLRIAMDPRAKACASDG